MPLRSWRRSASTQKTPTLVSRADFWISDSAVGGIIFADFADPASPQIERIHTDGLLPPGMSLCVTDTRGSHSELTGEFAAIRQEMEQIAAFLGKKVLGQVTESAFWAHCLRCAKGLRRPRGAARHPLF